MGGLGPPSTAPLPCSRRGAPLTPKGPVRTVFLSPVISAPLQADSAPGTPVSENGHPIPLLPTLGSVDPAQPRCSLLSLRLPPCSSPLGSHICHRGATPVASDSAAPGGTLLGSTRQAFQISCPYFLSCVNFFFLTGRIFFFLIY